MHHNSIGYNSLSYDAWHYTLANRKKQYYNGYVLERFLRADSKRVRFFSKLAPRLGQKNRNKE